ncbi:TonB-dependent receptor [Sphingomonas sp. UV9]|uniref:TonB-dependent receptor plug domain-containing protein n=1 Tax=Sphingomonas sp. UV9 TaxID=1851410 RepID=UPI000FFB52F8|nr:TonB-dependent receptor plug domain-containing protein [Sphingomonas sp. UV9]RXD02572.1 TonB-dependent receptor [Sphingomonas sp. UV9]
MKKTDRAGGGRHWLLYIGLLSTVCAPARSFASGPETFDIPSLPVVEAIERLSVLSNMSIGGTLRVDPRLRTRRVRGRMSSKTALREMLRGTGLRALQVGVQSFRLERITPRPNPVPALPPPPADPTPDIVVIASKRSLPAQLLGGSVEYVRFDTPLGGSAARRGPAELAERIPSIASTSLGRGRDKLFLRGIADSSFAGATEATLGEYLGEARINFNAPDPGLILYDVSRIELLKGAQGTLYGGGTLGGVLRIEPQRPNLSHTAGSVDATVSATHEGGFGTSLAAVINLPIVEDRAGARLLAYRTREAGYIDDVGRNLKDVNRTITSGGRGQVRFKPGRWQIDVAGTYQRTTSRDSNYSVAGEEPLTRRTSVAQPSSNSFSLLGVEVRGPAAGAELVSTTSVGRNNLSATYDGTVKAGSPAAFRDDRRLTTLNHETRLARSAATGAGWVVGMAAFAQRDEAQQTADEPALADLASNLQSDRVNVALFGQGSLRAGDLLLTAGLRGTYSRQWAETALDLTSNGFGSGGRTELNISPMAEIGWLIDSETSLGFSLRQGFRSGGASIYRVDQRFEDVLSPGFYSIYYGQDLIRAAALELSHRTTGSRPFDLKASVTAVKWNRTQGSIVDEYGFLYATNTNGSTVLNLDLSGSWLIRSDTTLRAGSSITRRVDIGPGSAVSEVPSVPVGATYGSIEWEKSLSNNWKVGMEARLAYRGKSRLGFGFLNEIGQGDALFTNAAVRIGHGSKSLTLSVDNILDDRSSLFGYGNPFTLRSERQTTPQRPRTLNVGLHADF